MKESPVFLFSIVAMVSFLLYVHIFVVVVSYF